MHKMLSLLRWNSIIFLMEDPFKFCEALHVYKGPCSYFSKDEISNIYTVSLAVWHFFGNHRRMKGLATESDWLLTG